MTTDDLERLELRRRAEKFLEDNPLFRKRYSEDDLDQLVEEIHIFQAELEVQNEELRHAQRELTESRDRYYDLYDFAPVGYCALDLNGAIQEINLAGAELLGRPRFFLHGCSLSRFVAAEDLTRLLAVYGQAMRDTARHECEVTIPGDKEGSSRNVRVGISAHRDPTSGLVGFRAVLSDVTELVAHRRDLQALNVELEERVAGRMIELELKNQQLKELTAELLRAEQRERHRLATDLHDHLAQLLVVASMRAQTALRLDDHEAAQLAIQDVMTYLKDAQRYTRTLVADLSPSLLFEEGLGAALRYLARSMESHGLRVEVLEERPVELPRDSSVLLYQCVREVLFNVLKHAGVDAAAVATSVQDGTLCIRVTDNGRGFDVDRVLADSKELNRFGLLSIKRRMEAIAGSCTIESETGKGSNVALFLPIKPLAPRVAMTDGIGAANRVPDGDISVIVVDDHQAVRAGLRRLLNEQPGVKVVGEAEDGFDALRQVRLLHPRAVVMDINMPRLNGIEATRQIMREFDDVTVLGFSIREDDDVKEAMARAGAKGFISKGAPVEKVCDLLKLYCSQT